MSSLAGRAGTEAGALLMLRDDRRSEQAYDKSDGDYLEALAL